LRKITHHFRSIYENVPQISEEKTAQEITTCHTDWT
jgi:hypothetical protein